MIYLSLQSTNSEIFRFGCSCISYKLLPSCPNAPLATSTMHTVSRDSGSIPDLMLLKDLSLPAPPVKPVPPTPDFSSACWYHPALAEQSIRNTRTTSSQCHSVKHADQKPQPNPEPYSGHATDKTSDAALLCLTSISLSPFPVCLPTGSHTAGERAHPATGHNDTTPQKQHRRLVTAAAQSCPPRVVTPGTLTSLPGCDPVRSLALREENKVLVDIPVLPSWYILRQAPCIAAAPCMERLPQQPTDAKGLAGKTRVLF